MEICIFIISYAFRKAIKAGQYALLIFINNHSHLTDQLTHNTKSQLKRPLVSPIMQFKYLSVLFLFPILAAAIPAPTGPPASSCNTGSLQCCNSVQSSKSTPVTTLAALLGIVLGPTTAQVGLSCSPLNIIGVGGNSWLALDNYDMYCPYGDSHTI